MNHYPLYKHLNIKSLKQLVQWLSEESPNKTAFQYFEKNKVVSVSYKEFRQDIEALGIFFHCRIPQKANIAVLGENSYDWILTYFTVVIGSNIVIPIDKELSDQEIAALLLRCEAKVLICSDSFMDTGQKLTETVKGLAVYNMKEYPSFLKKGQELLDDGFNSYWMNRINENDVCSIIFTSGTTGEPKGVMLTQKSLMADTIASCENVYISGTSLLTLPLHHTFAFTTGVLAMLVYKVPICISRSLRTFRTDMQVFKPQNMFLVPLYVENMYQTIWKTAKEQHKEQLLGLMIHLSNLLRKWKIDIRKRLFHSVHIQFGGNLDLLVCGGAFLEQKYIDGMEDIGIQVLNGYGITECSPVVAVNRNKDTKKGSVGLPLSCCDIRIVDGEICVKGDNVMTGYYHDNISTLEAVKDGWFRTGDLGYLDEDGFLFVTGRKKNLIILSNGKNVSAEELELRILGITGVREVVVSAENGIITAEVFAENETEIRTRIATLNRELPSYKRIQKVKFRKSAFEKTTTQKIRRI